jgi:anti-sigma factor RsiW
MNAELECERTLLVQADFDGELDAAQAAALIEHERRCAHCQQARGQLERSRALLRGAPRYAAPTKLRDVLAKAAPAPAAPSVRRRPLVWVSAIAAAIALVTVLLFPRSADVGTQLVANHVRAMQLESHLIDVVSTDHHTVKPWFAGKVSFAPLVKQLDSTGYILKGGRVDIVNGSPAAVLVYQAGRHIVDVYMWPASAGTIPLRASTQVEGFNLRHWHEGGLNVWCVSDMSADELDRFAQRWRQEGR